MLIDTGDTTHNMLLSPVEQSPAESDEILILGYRDNLIDLDDLDDLAFNGNNNTAGENIVDINGTGINIGLLDITVEDMKIAIITPTVYNQHNFTEAGNICGGTAIHFASLVTAHGDQLNQITPKIIELRQKIKNNARDQQLLGDTLSHFTNDLEVEAALNDLRQLIQAQELNPDHHPLSDLPIDAVQLLAPVKVLNNFGDITKHLKSGYWLEDLEGKIMSINDQLINNNDNNASIDPFIVQSKGHYFTNKIIKISDKQYAIWNFDSLNPNGDEVHVGRPFSELFKILFYYDQCDPTHLHALRLMDETAFVVHRANITHADGLSFIASTFRNIIIRKQLEVSCATNQLAGDIYDDLDMKYDNLQQANSGDQQVHEQNIFEYLSSLQVDTRMRLSQWIMNTLVQQLMRNAANALKDIVAVNKIRNHGVWNQNIVEAVHIFHSVVTDMQQFQNSIQEYVSNAKQYMKQIEQQQETLYCWLFDVSGIEAVIDCGTCSAILKDNPNEKKSLNDILGVAMGDI